MTLRWRLGVTCVLLGLTYLGGGGVASSQPARQAPAEKKPASLQVLVPAANCQLSIDDQPTKQTGVTRNFVTPPLEPGSNYYYKLTLVWQPNNYTTITRSKEVTVRAGEETKADLREADDKNPDKIHVRYVPTPQDVVEEMLKLADVGKDDVVYDLGCGDGRIVVTAVAKFGAKRGVGVDIDPERIKDSKANAEQAKVQDRVDIRQADVLEMKDLSTASVVMLYMGEAMNLRLRPILQKSLKQGSRVVSHRFTMGDWQPQKTITVTDGRGEKYLLHLWIIGKE